MSIEIVKGVRARFGTPLAESHPRFLLELVAELGPEWGLLIKTGGTRITLPNGVQVSQDVITDRVGTQVDVLGDGEGAAVPVWNFVDPAHYTPDPKRFYRLDETIPGPPVESITLAQRVINIENALNQLAVAVSQSFNAAQAEFDNINDTLTNLRAELEKPVETSRTWGHTHTVDRNLTVKETK
jgi:hypothetical protein